MHCVGLYVNRTKKEKNSGLDENCQSSVTDMVSDGSICAAVVAAVLALATITAATR